MIQPSLFIDKPFFNSHSSWWDTLRLSPGVSCMVRLDVSHHRIYLWPQRAVSLGGPRHFWDCRTRLGPPKKRPCATHWWGVWQIQLTLRAFMLLDWATLGQPCWRITVRSGVSLLSWQFVMTSILEPQGAVPPGLYPLRRGRIYCLVPEGNADGAWGIFGTIRRVWASVLRWHDSLSHSSVRLFLTWS